MRKDLGWLLGSIQPDSLCKKVVMDQGAVEEDLEKEEEENDEQEVEEEEGEDEDGSGLIIRLL